MPASYERPERTQNMSENSLLTFCEVENYRENKVSCFRSLGGKRPLWTRNVSERLANKVHIFQLTQTPFTLLFNPFHALLYTSPSCIVAVQGRYKASLTNEPAAASRYT